VGPTCQVVPFLQPPASDGNRRRIRHATASSALPAPTPRRSRVLPTSPPLPPHLPARARAREGGIRFRIPPLFLSLLPTSPAKSGGFPATSSPPSPIKSLSRAPSLVSPICRPLPCLLTSPRRSPLAPPLAAASGRTLPSLEPSPRRAITAARFAAARATSAAARFPSAATGPRFPHIAGEDYLSLLLSLLSLPCMPPPSARASPRFGHAPPPFGRRRRFPRRWSPPSVVVPRRRLAPVGLEAELSPADASLPLPFLPYTRAPPPLAVPPLRPSAAAFRAVRRRLPAPPAVVRRRRLAMAGRLEPCQASSHAPLPPCAAARWGPPAGGRPLPFEPLPSGPACRRLSLPSLEPLTRGPRLSAPPPPLC
jgi:hypothetical protein